MSSDVALRVTGLGKKYTIRHKDHDHVTMAQAALHRIRHPRGAIGREEFWALKDVEFEVPRGEVLGVIGHNGAGKSTLLKVLSRITPPTTGRVEVFGRIGSLLEVGTGFHPELTGRENVYLNGSILGMKKKEIDRQFDAIVDFSGVSQFLDTPVKRYSSGMYVRLAFAVAAHLDTEILLLDEVLAVGDAEFQRACFDRIHGMARDGRTILLVSHSMASIENISTIVAILSEGRLSHLGDPSTEINRYIMSMSRQRSVRQESQFDINQGSVRISSVSCHKTSIRQGEPLSFSVAITASRDTPCSVNARLSSDGVPVGLAWQDDSQHMSVGARECVECDIDLGALAPGRYVIDIGLVSGQAAGGYTQLDAFMSALEIEIQAALTPHGAPAWDRSWGFYELPAIRVAGSRHNSLGDPS